jgi:hypothetical protein
LSRTSCSHDHQQYPKRVPHSIKSTGIGYHQTEGQHAEQSRQYQQPGAEILSIFPDKDAGEDFK